LFNHINKKIIVSRDVLLDESDERSLTSNVDEEYKWVVIEFEQVETNEEQNVESSRVESTSTTTLRKSKRNNNITKNFRGFEMTSYANVDEDDNFTYFSLFS